MAFTKYASLESAEVLGIKGSQNRARTASLDKFADYDEFRTEDGYLYARIRAISSRVNKNHDGWPSVELAGGEDTFNRFAGQKTAFTVEADSDHEYGYSTFLGKPIFVDHHNTDPEKARGVIVDAKLHVEDHKTASELDPYYADAPDNHTPPTWVELLLEVDAQSFPRLAKAIIEGSKDPNKGIDGFSMGCDVEKSVCNICKNAATSPDEYCEHVKMKGAEFPTFDEHTGHKTGSKKSYEDCYGIKFFEISAVFDPADETALLRELIQHEGSTQEEDAAPAGSLLASLAHDPAISKTAAGVFDQDDPGEERNEILPAGAYVNNPQLEDEHLLSEVQREAIQRLRDEVESGQAHPATSYNDLTPDQLAEEYGLAGGDSLGVNPVDPPEYQPHPQRTPGPEEQEYEATKFRRQLDQPLPPEFRASITAKHKAYQMLKAANLPIPPDLKADLQKFAENPLPQSELLHAPDEVETLRNEHICPVCGSSMDDETCEICGYIEPPEGFNNPDLEKAKETDLSGDVGLESDLTEPAPEPSQGLEGPTGLATPPPSNPSNPGLTAGVRNEMSQWKVHIDPRIAARINVKEKPISTSTEDQTNEPKETTVQDETKPVTSSVRTASDFIAAAERGKENNMSDTQKVAAEPVPAASPDKRVDVEGVGGVADSSNEQASKADAQTDVVGKGSTPVTDVSADQENVNVAQGDEHSKNIEGTPTKTWSGEKGQTSPVQGDVYPSENGQGAGKWSAQHVAYDSEPYPKEDGGLSGGSAAQGTQPADPVGKADDRVDVLKPVTSPSNNSGPTDTWSGTDGNGVTRQQDPVTRDTLEGSDIVNLSPSKSSSHIFSSIKLADLEVEIGLIDADEKYERMAELEGKSPEVVQASLEYVGKIKSRVATKRSTARVAHRLPSLHDGGSRVASVPSPTTEVSDEETGDAGLFL